VNTSTMYTIRIISSFILAITIKERDESHFNILCCKTDHRKEEEEVGAMHLTFPSFIRYYCTTTAQFHLLLISILLCIISDISGKCVPTRQSIDV
jgi:hypothetical protein